jgi:hypothetical protein
MTDGDAHVAREEHIMHGQLAFEDTCSIREEGPLLACALASSIGRLLAMRCYVQIEVLQPHPSEAFAMFRARVGCDSPIDLQQIMFRPVHLTTTGLDAAAWFTRGDTARCPPRAANRAHGRTTQKETSVAVITEQMLTAVKRGGRVGMSVDALLRTTLHLLADDVRAVAKRADVDIGALG